MGELRRDPFAMLPFCGYHMADYFAHWVRVPKLPGIAADKLPGLYMVNWFRTDAAGQFAWPGFGDNIRVLEWIVRRLEGTVQAQEAAIGGIPTRDGLNLQGLSLDESALQLLLMVDVEEWRREASSNAEYLDSFGEPLPQALREEHRKLSCPLATESKDRI